MIINILKNLIIMVMIFSTPSFSLQMKIQQNCGIKHGGLQVEIGDPAGGFAQVNSDGTVNFPRDVQEGSSQLPASARNV